MEQLKSFLLENKDLLILYSLYHGYHNARSQGISIHDICLIPLE